MLIPQEDVLLKKGLIVGVRDNPGIGFRNHTVPIDLVHGGTWSEDLTWLEPVTSCIDTNLTIEIRTLDSIEDWAAEETVYLVDKGALRDLDVRALQTRPWGDNQTLDLFGRAYKAARMYNVLVANSLNVSPPLPLGEDTISRLDTQVGVLNSTLNMDDIIFSIYNPDLIKIREIKGLKDEYYDRNQSVVPPSDFVDQYEDGQRKLLRRTLRQSVQNTPLSSMALITLTANREYLPRLLHLGRHVDRLEGYQHYQSCRRVRFFDRRRSLNQGRRRQRPIAADRWT